MTMKKREEFNQQLQTNWRRQIRQMSKFYFFFRVERIKTFFCFFFRNRQLQDEVKIQTPKGKDILADLDIIDQLRPGQPVPWNVFEKLKSK